MKDLLESLSITGSGLKLNINLNNGEDICGTRFVAIIGRILITRDRDEIFLIRISSIAFVSIDTHNVYGDALVENIVKVGKESQVKVKEVKTKEVKAKQTKVKKVENKED